MGFVSNRPEGYIDFAPNIGSLESIKGTYLGSGIYGAKLDESHADNSEHWLSIIGKILAIIIIILHAIYIGNNLLYKVDNTLIFAQTVFLFSFVKLLVGIPLAQFFNGFRWMHWGLFPNYFQETIPNGYIEGFAEKVETPNPYRLLTMDANFFRNTGFAFSLILTFIVAFGLICLVLLILKGAGKYEVWYGRIACDAWTAAFEFISMIMVYWATAHLLYNGDPLLSNSYFKDHQKPEMY